jgi:hypothetical protein
VEIAVRYSSEVNRDVVGKVFNVAGGRRIDLNEVPSRPNLRVVIFTVSAWEEDLVQVTEEEKHILPGSDVNIARLTSSSDLNGALQPIRREVVKTKNIGNGVEKADTMVMLPSVYGG